MKNKFGLWPKIALLLILAAFTFNKFQRADKEMKAGITDPVSIVETKTPPLPVMYSQAPVDAVDVDTVGTDTGEDPAPPVESGGAGAWLKKYWGELLLLLFPILEFITRLTPSDKDNSILNFLKFIIDKIVPNRRTEGGTH